MTSAQPSTHGGPSGRHAVRLRTIWSPTWHLVYGAVLLIGGLVLLVGNRLSDTFDPALAYVAGMLPIAWVTTVVVWQVQAGRRYDTDLSTRRPTV